MQREELSPVFLEHEDWPEWFALDFYQGFGRKDPPRLILGIAKEPLRRLVDFLPKCRVLDICKERLQECGVEEDLFTKQDFLLDTSKPWGFDGVLEPFERKFGAATRSYLAEYSIKVPQIEYDVGECEDCGGTRETDGMECFHCMGTGRQTEMRRDDINRVAATLGALSIILDKPDKGFLGGLDTKRKQLLSVLTAFTAGRAFISAVLSRQFGDYLRRLSNRELPEAKAAIKSAYLYMFPRYKRFGDYHYGAMVHRNGQLILRAPGDACDLGVDGFSRSLEETSGPLKLHDHNVDSPAQQLALLCGLAALTGIARRNIRPGS